MMIAMNAKFLNRLLRIIAAAVVTGMLLSVSSAALAFSRTARSELLRRVGPRDAVVLADPDGRILFEKNADRLLVPASILKLFTSLVALHALGPDYRYVTRFYLDSHRNLTVKGYGDPLLVSEVVTDICGQLAAVLSDATDLNHLRLDESHFLQPLTIPGVSASSQPYDAPNGALGVNFNTVNFKRFENRYISAEPQTPLLPFALERIKKKRIAGGRMVLSRRDNESTIYAGKLFQYFLEKQGVRFMGSVKLARIGQTDRLILTYRSPYVLTEVIAKLLEYSNNFITNQLLITAGIRAYDAPGSLDKGVQAARRYAADILGIDRMRIVEGSGISRDNRISAIQMLQVLKRFDPHYKLMRRGRIEFYKTGTLRGISTRAGYLVNPLGRRYPYVVMRNTPGKAAQSLMSYLKLLV